MSEVFLQVREKAMDEQREEGCPWYPKFAPVNVPVKAPRVGRLPAAGRITAPPVKSNCRNLG